MLTTTLDSRELKFLIRQIDEYIQVTEFMIRKTATLDHGELALARNLRTKLSQGTHAGEFMELSATEKVARVVAHYSA